ncbi:MAG: Helix-turn-helix domain [Thermoplasmata archaeon]|jgi:DNA-binding transcriptional ArsR family regulator|nr:Helix-turn-helix domain [Thermoplasmata archaeon]
MAAKVSPWLLVALGALLLVPAAAASPVEGRLESTGPTRILGDNSFVLDATALLFERGAGDASFRLDAAQATASLVLVQTTQVRTAVGLASDPIRGPERVVARQELSGALLMEGTPDSPGTTTRVLARGEPLALGVDGSRDLRVGVAGGLSPAGHDASFGSSPTLLGQTTRPDEAGAFAEGLPATLTWTQGFVALSEGGRVRLPDGATWSTGRAFNQTASLVDPATGTGRYVYDNRILVVQGRGAMLALADPAAGWTAAATGLAGTLDGDIAWTGVQADVWSDGRRLPADPQLFQLRGELTLAARFADADGWELSGTAHFVNVDGFQVPAGATAATAAGAGLLAALLLAFTEPGRGLLAFTLGRHAPRLVKSAPLRSPARRRILDAIHLQQPVRVTELRRTTGLSKTALAYHLRVLLAYEVIQQSRGPTGRNTAFMLNSGSLVFRVFGQDVGDGQPDSEGVLASTALAAVNGHPIRRSLHAILQERGPLDFSGLNEGRSARGEPALVQSSATHHLQLLERAGAIVGRRQGKRKVYSVVVDAGDARVEQYRRFLLQVRAIDLVRSLARGPATEQQLLAAGAQPGAKGTLDRLAALGLVEYDPPQRSYQLAEFLRPLVPRL